MRIYLDNCVLNRPFDDQTQERIYLETQAFLILLKYVEDGIIDLVTSVANDYENYKIKNIYRKEKIQSYFKLATFEIHFDEQIEMRSKELTKLGFIGIDALHLACAEKAKVDYFVSCDDRLLERAKKNSHQIRIKVVSLLKILEVIYHVKNN